MEIPRRLKALALVGGAACTLVGGRRSSFLKFFFSSFKSLVIFLETVLIKI